jgi:hypothetical protein
MVANADSSRYVSYRGPHQAYYNALRDYLELIGAIDRANLAGKVGGKLPPGVNKADLRDEAQRAELDESSRRVNGAAQTDDVLPNSKEAQKVLGKVLGDMQESEHAERQQKTRHRGNIVH